jgi:hypothetical protein
MYSHGIVRAVVIPGNYIEISGTVPEFIIPASVKFYQPDRGIVTKPLFGIDPFEIFS